MPLSRHALNDAAQRFGTPLYVYDETELAAALRRFQRAFGQARLLYGMRVNPNLHLLRRYAGAGLGFECVSLGELRRAQATGVGGERLVLSGPAKTDEEYAAAAELGVTISVDRADEIALLPPASRVLVRVNPQLEPGAHDSVSPAAARSKFGLLPEQVPAALQELTDAGHEVLGLHVVLGAAVQQGEDWAGAFARVLALRPEVGEVPVLLIGGEWGPKADLDGVAYEAHEAARAFGAELWVEPGRSLVAAAGWLLTRVVGIKRTGRNFCLVDAGMTEFVRPMLYGAAHPLYPMWDALATEIWDIAGPAEESGDLLARGVTLPTPQRGHLLVIGDVGAYGAGMSSSYLSRSRPAEALWDGQEWHLIRRREVAHELWATEVSEPLPAR